MVTGRVIRWAHGLSVYWVCYKCLFSVIGLYSVFYILYDNMIYIDIFIYIYLSTYLSVLRMG